RLLGGRAADGLLALLAADGGLRARDVTGLVEEVDVARLHLDAARGQLAGLALAGARALARHLPDVAALDVVEVVVVSLDAQLCHFLCHIGFSSVGARPRAAMIGGTLDHRSDTTPVGGRPVARRWPACGPSVPARGPRVAGLWPGAAGPRPRGGPPAAGPAARQSPSVTRPRRFSGAGRPAPGSRRRRRAARARSRRSAPRRRSRRGRAAPRARPGRTSA